MGKMSVKQLRELGSKVVGCLPTNLGAATAQGWIDNPAALREVLHGALIVGAKKKVACSFADIIPKGWTVVEDVAPTAFADIKLKPVSFLKQGESSISGDEMRKRAVEFKGNLGLADGKRMLAEHDKIPAEFRDFYILLPGTVLRDSGDDLSVPYLDFDDGSWVLDFRWLDLLDWDDDGRFARCE